ncbi:MAG: hypothetical protein KDC54_03485 [Lewinella sp.]|nr:hypothetical protein [Lewinella sp.]
MATQRSPLWHLRNLSWWFLLLLAGWWFLFALLSGAGEYGGGLRGLVMNSPNALPWALLLVLVFLARNRPRLGGIFIALFGALTIVFFRTWQAPLMLGILSLPLMVLGSLLSWADYRLGRTDGPFSY